MNKKSFILVTLCVSLSLFSSLAISAPEPLVTTAEPLALTTPKQYPEFTFVGQTTMRWLWLDIYQAKLRTPTGTYVKNKWPVTLELIYARNIKNDELIEATIEDWDRQKITYEASWIQSLKEIWPNITPGDRLLLYVDNQTQSHFYFNDSFVGLIEDKDFAHAFTSIWLSDNTLKPKLRAQLIGEEIGENNE